LAWLRLNAYGILLAGLAVLGMADFINPGGTDLARLIGEVPHHQPLWIIGYVLAGLLLLWGFVRTDRIPETIGLALLNAALLLHTAVAFDYLGWTDYTLTRVALILIIGCCSWARISVLWTKRGLMVTIPPRNGGDL
jgi:hypothetical protein